ncbi:NUDIX domain-containing protein [Candidatus Woesearchaeota archaeon]|nr:NUDIX domain-containing protein [Candidatus Woesearchaeota archaeon]
MKNLESNVRNTISAGGIIVRQYKGIKYIVLVDQHRTSYSFPKGHVENGECFLETAYREIMEECGLSRENIVLVGEIGSYQRNAIRPDGLEDICELKNIMMYHFTTDAINLSPRDMDNPNAFWVPISAARDYLNIRDREFYDRIVSQL